MRNRVFKIEKKIEFKVVGRRGLSGPVGCVFDCLAERSWVRYPASSVGFCPKNWSQFHNFISILFLITVKDFLIRFFTLLGHY